MYKKELSRKLFAFMILPACCLLLYPGHGRADCNGDEYPFFPSLIRLTTGKTADINDFKPSKSCRACHIGTFKEWDGSSHSLAFQDPIFLAMWRLGEKDTQGKTNIFCVGCHAPIGLLTEDITAPEDHEGGNVVSQEGIHCDFCHSVLASNYECSKAKSPNNSSFLVQPGELKMGPIDNCKSTFHTSAYSELHTRSEFCGNCHNLFHYETGFKIVNTYEEWQTSIYAKSGIACQDCHMMPVKLAMETADMLVKAKYPGKASSLGPKRDTVHVHKFVGGSPIIKMDSRSNRHQIEAKKRLNSATRLEVKPNRSDGKYSLKISVYNERAGHNIPTGMPGIRQIWIEVIVRDKNGKEVFHSGAVDSEGRFKDNAVCFSKTPVDKKGQPTLKPWAIAGFKTDTTIPPKGKREYDMELKLPDGIAWPLTAKVILNYRGFPQSLVDELLPDYKAKIDIMDIAEQEITIEQ